MAKKDLKAVAEAMRKIDFGMLTTRTEHGAAASRPMSNNGDVEYQGQSFFFSEGSARTVNDIEGDDQVGLTFTGSAGLLGQRPLFIAVEGHAKLIRDKAQFVEHWTKDLDVWFEKGIDTPGLVLIAVKADRIHYWEGGDEGEIAL